MCPVLASEATQIQEIKVSVIKISKWSTKKKFLGELITLVFELATKESIENSGTRGEKAWKSGLNVHEDDRKYQRQEDEDKT